MPRPTPIKIFRIAETKVNPEAVQHWLEHLNANEFRQNIPSENEISDPALLVALAGRRCYMSFQPGLNPNVTRIRKDYVDYFDNILSSRHGSVLEHATFSYAIEGVSRVFTGEMNRHRVGWGISEGSMRFIRFDKDIAYWVPTSIQDDESDDDDLRHRKEESRKVFTDTFNFVEEKYSKLMSIWNMNETDKNFTYKKKITSMMRRIVPMGVATGGIWTGNVRALRHVIAMRATDVAEEEIFYVFAKIADDIIESQPLMFGDFKRDKNGGFTPQYWKV